jgi:ketosteroid isomerase-like protein
MNDKADPTADRIGFTALLDRFYDAEVRYIAAGGSQRGADFAEMAACFHPDAVLHQGPSTPFPGHWATHAGLEKFFSTMADTWLSGEDLKVNYFTADNGVAVDHRVTLRSRATGKKVDVRLGQFVTFENGLIRDFWVYYFDPVALTEVCLP